VPLVSIADLNGDTREVLRGIELAKSLAARYEHFLATADDDADRPAGIHASEIASCLRQTVYTLTSAEKQGHPSPFWKRRFEMGHAVHRMVQDHFQAMAIKTHGREAASRAARGLARDAGCTLHFEPEVQIAPHLQPLAATLSVHSKCDGVFTFLDTWTGAPLLRVGLEIKTESPDGFEQLKEPKPEHLRQAHLYMACLDLPVLWFFYFSKGTLNNTPSHAPFLVPFDPEIWKGVEARCLDALGAAERGELPDREESIRCEFCPYAWHCQPAFLNRSPKNDLVVLRVPEP
jgi:hypothetical protein